jgi:predicted protein tyrosine phosphatase
MNKKIRILALCRTGVVRSAAFTTELKSRHEYVNIVNAGLQNVQPDTLAMLIKWADVVYVVGNQRLFNLIPIIFRAKCKLVDVGSDVWHNAEDPRLKQVIRKKIEQLGL